MSFRCSCTDDRFVTLDNGPILANGGASIFRSLNYSRFLELPRTVTFDFEFIAGRPIAPAGYEYVSTSISTDGKGLFLFTQKLLKDRVLGTFRNAGGAIFPNTSMNAEARFKLIVLYNGTATEIDLPPLDITFPICDLFCDGRILLAGARCRWRGTDDFDRNGVIFDPATGQISRILLGDGIANLSIDANDRIWVSYFDEGVFGNFGWNHPGPPGPGAGGLVCFADDGKELWAFNGLENSAFIDDCYAFNAQREERWAYFYSDFDLCSVDGNFRSEILSGVSVSGSSAFAVADQGFLFSSQYREPTNTFHLVQRNGQSLGRPQSVIGRLPDRNWIDRCQLAGRGAWMHVVNDDGWFATDFSAQLA